MPVPNNVFILGYLLLKTICMKIFSFFLTMVLVIVFAACSQKSNPGKTVAVEEVKVKSITYTGDIMPLLQAKCSPCHLPSKGGPTPLWQAPHEPTSLFADCGISRDVVFVPGHTATIAGARRFAPR